MHCCWLKDGGDHVLNNTDNFWKPQLALCLQTAWK